MARRHELDLVRISVFLLLIIYHVSLMYGSREFFLKAPDSNIYFDIIHLLSHPWRMSLLFLISGVATAFALERISATELRSRRSRQLLFPLLIGIALLIPPQLYVYFNGVAGMQIGIFEVFARYLTLSPFDLPDGGQHVIVRMEHLWYLAYLWVYTALLALLVSMAHDRIPAAGTWLAALLRGAGLLFWPAALFVLLRVVLRPHFPPTTNLVNDWYSHGLYLSCFLGGVLLGRQEEFWQQLGRMRRPALIVALCCVPALLYQFSMAPLGDHDTWNSIAGNLVLGPFRWCMIVAILGYAQMLRDWRPRALQYLNKAILTYYVLHQTLMLLIAFWLDRMGMFNIAAFVPIVALTLAACAIVYEGWRRLNGLLARPQLA
ncbi:acyltransferase family protein [Neorhizobium sp. NCHU2750]|uniref:acyltransferase family protein n=1 Tax=Neorhizobium sp. NCHU2750 TaxID=1825976 RepID=UPI000E715840|nr:acyltransferase [Neorhizobium sp. NCHU2750]